MARLKKRLTSVCTVLNLQPTVGDLPPDNFKLRGQISGILCPFLVAILDWTIIIPFNNQIIIVIMDI